MPFSLIGYDDQTGVTPNVVILHRNMGEFVTDELGIITRMTAFNEVRNTILLCIETTNLLHTHIGTA